MCTRDHHSTGPRCARRQRQCLQSTALAQRSLHPTHQTRWTNRHRTCTLKQLLRGDSDHADQHKAYTSEASTTMSTSRGAHPDTGCLFATAALMRRFARLVLTRASCSASRSRTVFRRHASSATWFAVRMLRTCVRASMPRVPAWILRAARCSRRYSVRAMRPRAAISSAVTATRPFLPLYSLLDSPVSWTVVPTGRLDIFKV